MGRHGFRSQIALGGLALALVASACGGGSDSSTESSGGTGGDTYTELIAGGVSSLDSSNIQGFQNQDVVLKWEAGLLQYESTPIDGGPCVELPTSEDLVPTGLVESYQRSEDGTKLEFVLNPVESAYGNTLTSADVLWSLERAAEVDPTANYLMFTLSGFDEANPLTIQDDTTFTINLSDPRSFSASLMTTLWMVIYDSTEAKKHATPDDPWATEWLSSNMANFGPWKLEQFQPGVSSTYVRNPNQEATGSIDRMVMSTITDAGNRLQLISGGEATLAKNLSFLQLESLADTDDLTLTRCPSAYQDFMGFNSQNEALKDVNVRKAISMAINRDEIIDSVYRGFAAPSTAGVPSAFDPTEGTSSYEFDVAEAKKLMEAAGYGDGLDLGLTLSPTNPGEYITSLGVSLKAQLAAIGVNLTINSIGDATTFSDTLAKGDFDLFIYPSAPAFAEAGQAYLNISGCEARQNYGKLCFPEIDQAAADVSRNLAPTQADIDALSVLVNDNLPTVAIADTQGVFAMRNCATALPVSPVFPTTGLLSSTDIEC